MDLKKELVLASFAAGVFALASSICAPVPAYAQVESCSGCCDSCNCSCSLASSVCSASAVSFCVAVNDSAPNRRVYSAQEAKIG